jgi:hypothetical protein
MVLLVNIPGVMAAWQHCPTGAEKLRVGQLDEARTKGWRGSLPTRYMSVSSAHAARSNQHTGTLLIRDQSRPTPMDTRPLAPERGLPDRQ